MASHKKKKEERDTKRFCENDNMPHTLMSFSTISTHYIISSSYVIFILNRAFTAPFSQKVHFVGPHLLSQSLD